MLGLIPIDRFVADWLLDNMTPEMTPYGMSLDVSVSPIKNKF